MTSHGLTYQSAGVDIEAGDEAVERIKGAASRTHIKGVLGGIGGFGSLFSLKDALGDLDDPVLVSGTDGVGTKLLVAIAAGRHDTVGQDLVAMCVNDILTVGARPLFFLDYFGTGRLDPGEMATVVSGIARACEAVGCALTGGETAELPGLYRDGDYDLAGFCVGVVERSAIIDGSRQQVGDTIIGLSSSGLHSNGFSLARAVLRKRGLEVGDELLEGKTVAELLLEPTRLYVRPVLSLLAQGVTVGAMAHITGGGLPGNLTRGFRDGLGARIDRGSWIEPALFGYLRDNGPVDDDEMLRAFNLGIGFCLTVSPGDTDRTLAHFAREGIPAQVIGEVTGGSGVHFHGERRS
ncbi:MAG: phosphoribosylformylglycinamidine cyclo-ligase [Myxococcota bacterium]